MAKTCKCEGCNNPVFSNLYCQRHQYMRTDEKYLTKQAQPKKVYVIKKKVYTLKRNATPTGEAVIFREIAVERPLISFISGLRVKGVVSNFAHVLAKGKFPHYRLHKPNIVLLTEKEHELFDAGTEEQREKYKVTMGQGGVVVNWDKLYQLRDELKQTYF